MLPSAGNDTSFVIMVPGWNSEPRASTSNGVDAVTMTVGVDMVVAMVVVPAVVVVEGVKDGVHSVGMVVLTILGPQVTRISASAA